MEDKARSHWDEIGRQAAEHAKNVNTGAAEFMGIMQEHLLRANAEVLRGLLKAIEDRLEKTQQQVAAVQVPITSSVAPAPPVSEPIVPVVETPATPIPIETPAGTRVTRPKRS